MTFLALKHGISRGQDTFGYNLVTLADNDTGKRFRTCGGGYDMVGTVFGKWLQDNHQNKLLTIAHDCDKAYDTVNKRYIHRSTDQNVFGFGLHDEALYGSTCQIDDNGQVLSVSLDGACGLVCMIVIAKRIALQVETVYKRDKKERIVDKLGFNVVAV